MTAQRRWTITVAALIFLAATTCRAQQAPPTREAIEAEFHRNLTQAERTRIERLATLAAGQPRAEAAKTYAEIFRFAIASGLFAEAEPVAEALLRSGGAPSEVALLAELINILAEADRGAYQESLDHLSAALKSAAAEGAPRSALPIAARMTLLNLYAKRLTQTAHYDAARQALTTIRDAAVEPSLKALAAAKLAQVELVGKPAPPLAGTSIDGKPVNLADFKGDVVLVVFWASWCLPCGTDAERLGVVEAADRAKGFRVLGVNLDTMQDGGVTPESVLPNVRRFLVDHNVRWPNLMSGPGADYAKAFGVTEIPASVLIGRDGTVLHLDLNESNLEPVLAKALGN